jgi:NADH-quinone oxidoreductase subunit E
MLSTCCPEADRRTDAAVHHLIGIRPGETDANATFSLGSGNCLGCCTLGPEIIVDGQHHGRLTPAEVEAVLKHYA